MIIPVLLTISFVVVLIYLFSELFAHKKEKNEWKEKPFAAGIDLPTIKQIYESKVASYALLFLVFDILAFMLVFSRGVFYPLLYISIVLMGLIMIRNVI